MSFLDWFIPIIQNFSVLAYVMILLLAFLESVAFFGIVIPGTFFLVVLGFLSSHEVFNVKTLFIFSVAGALLGDSLSFYLGKKSDKFFKPDSKVFKTNYLEKGQGFIEKYGNGSVVFGRFIGRFRAIIPFVMGRSKMEEKKFWFYEVLSVISWSVVFLSAGYLFGEAWQAISLWSDRLSAVLFWLFIFLVIFYSLKWVFIKKGKAVIIFFISLVVSIAEGVKSNSNIQKYFNHHPKLARFLKQRLDWQKFDGLTLTAVAIAIIYTITSFTGTAINVFITRNFIDTDLSLANLLYAFRNPLLVKVFLWVTLLGKWQIAATIIFAAMVIFYVKGYKKYIIPLFISVGGAVFTGTVAKYIWHRPRPEEVGVYLEKSWSFPSGHAVLAVSLFGFLIYFFWKHLKKWKNKINALFFGLLVIILIGFSRLYLGVHYLSDVWAGYLVGLVWLLLSILFIESKYFKFIPWNNEDIQKITGLKYSKFIIGGTLFLLAGIYMGYGFKYEPLYGNFGEEANVSLADSGGIESMFKTYKLSQFSETLSGSPQEPVSFIIIAGSDSDLVSSFQKSGWFLADGVNFNSVAVAFKFELLNKPYPEAPMTPSFWDTHTNDFGFEKPTEINSVRYRHHARFWRTNFTVDGRNIYFGVASLDTGVKWWGLTHRIRPDIDSEREYLFEDLSKEVVNNFKKVQFVDPVLGKNFTGDQFFTDGKAYIINLK